VQSDKVQLGQGAERQGAALDKVQLHTRCSFRLCAAAKMEKYIHKKSKIFGTNISHLNTNQCNKSLMIEKKSNEQIVLDIFE
jgi:hypothetical protein